MTSKVDIVCVLGMHRSGTSLMSRILHELGLDLGPEDHLIEPSTANPTGYWESAPIKSINDGILERLGGSWIDPPSLEPGWERSTELADLRREARELVEADFSGSRPWGFKDPRTCLTLPFWQRILGPMRYVICLRNPLDVASSLAAREEDAVPFESGVGLWLTYVRSSLAATAGHARELFFYEDLMAEPEPIVMRLARMVGRKDADDVPAAVRVAMSEALWHHRTTAANVIDADEVSFGGKTLYLALRQFALGPERVDIEVLDILGSYAAEADRDLAALDAARLELAKAHDRLSATEVELGQRRSEIERLEATHAEALNEHEAEIGRLELALRDEQRLRTRFQSGVEEAAARGAPTGEAARPGAVTSGPAGGVVNEVRARARELVPDGATVLVAAKGDDAMLELGGPRGRHFPVSGDGRYLGYHPAGDSAVIAQLEASRAQGADHLLLTPTTLWWLDHYKGLRRHLEDRYQRLCSDECCAIYELGGSRRGGQTGAFETVNRAVTALRVSSNRDPSVLDLRTGLGLVEQLSELSVFSPPDEGPGLPYLDRTVDVVVVPRGAEAIGEARRVASGAVVMVGRTAAEPAAVEWVSSDLGAWGKDVSVTLVSRPGVSDWTPTLEALGESIDEGFAGRISVVGDASELERSEATAAPARPIVKVEVPAAAGFAERARAASFDCRVQVFISAPAVPLPGWLPPVLSLFTSDRGAGVVGPRILSRLGSLEEAGGILDDGEMRRRGEGDPNPDRPEYRFVRRIDFCSPPLLAASREVVGRLDGFADGDSAEPMVDFSLRAGRLGVPVYYQPQARLVSMAEEGL